MRLWLMVLGLLLELLERLVHAPDMVALAVEAVHRHSRAPGETPEHPAHDIARGKPPRHATSQ
jgi:hypothetical protein